MVAPIGSQRDVQDKAYAALRHVIGRRTSTVAAPRSGSTSASSPGFRHLARRCARRWARARRLRALGAAARHLRRAQDQARGDRADPGLGGAGEHGGAADHPARQRRPTLPACGACSQPSKGNKLHAKLDEYSEVNITFHQTLIDQRQPGADQAGREPVHPYAHDPRPHDRRRTIASTARSAIT